MTRSGGLLTIARNLVSCGLGAGRFRRFNAHSQPPAVATLVRLAVGPAWFKQLAFSVDTEPCCLRMAALRCARIEIRRHEWLCEPGHAGETGLPNRMALEANRGLEQPRRYWRQRQSSGSQHSRRDSASMRSAIVASLRRGWDRIAGEGLTEYPSLMDLVQPGDRDAPGKLIGK